MTSKEAPRKTARKAEPSSEKAPSRKRVTVYVHPLIAPERTDVGNAERLIHCFGDELRYVRRLGWLHYTGQRWQYVEDAAVFKLMKETLVRTRKEGVNLCDEPQGPTGRRLSERAAFRKFVNGSESLHRIAAAVKLAQTVGHTWIEDVDKLDADPWLFNCANGTIDLRTGKLRGHNPADLITQMTPVRYDPKAKCPRFDKFLQEVTCGDKDLETFLQHHMGYRATGDVREQLFFIYHGDGERGKSTFKDLMLHVLGDYAHEAAPDILTSKHYSEHPTELMDLKGRRLVWVMETESGQRLRVSRMKRLTGDERVKGRYMRQDWTEFRRTFEPVLVTNHLPQIDDPGRAAWRRILVVPWEFEPPQRDRQLLNALKGEERGILRWIVEGCKAWYKLKTIPIPKAVRDATASYKAEQDSVARFIADPDQCVPGLTFTAPARRLYDGFIKWGNGNPAVAVISETEFAKRMKELGYKRRRRNVGVVYEGFAFNGS